MTFDYDFTLLIMVFMRMSGCILFNPILGRKSIPNTLKIGLTMVLAFFTYSVIPPKDIAISSVLVLGIVLVKELLIGFIVGFIMQLFFAVLILAGEMMDMQIGISMSKIYDPQSNVSMPVSASLLNAMMMLIFFISNGHLALIKIFCQLGQVSPYGELAFSPDLFKELVSLFSLILIYSVKLSLPLLAVELIAEMGVGLLMKAVPQIDVFVVNLQLKIMIGFATIMILVPSFSAFLERLLVLMFDQINRIFVL